MKRRIGSLGLALAMILALLPAGAVPARAADMDEGTETTVAEGGSGYLDGANTSRNLAAGPDGTIYVVYNSGGKIMLTTRPKNASEFTEPVEVASGTEAEVAVSSTGWVFVAYNSGGLKIKYSDNGSAFSDSALTIQSGDSNASSMHLATDGNYVYAVARTGHYLYRSEDGGANFTEVELTAPAGFAHVYSDVLVDSSTHKVIVVEDDPDIFYWVSENRGNTFTGPTDAESSINYTTATCGDGYVYMAGSGNTVLVIDLKNGTANTKTVNSSASGQGRSIAADNMGNLIIGGGTGSAINVLISNEGIDGLESGTNETISGASAANVAVNPVTGSLLFLYEKGGKLTLKEYGGVLQGYKTATVRFLKNGNDVTGTMEDQIVEADQSTPLTPNDFKREGYTFTGWNTKSDGTGDAYSDKKAVKLSEDETLVLYAQWAKDVLTVTFDANGSNDAEGEMEPQLIESNTGTALHENEFTRAGYTFTGWNTQPDGSGDEYADKQVISLTGDLTLYAQWERDKLTIKYVANAQGVTNMPTDQSKTQGEAVTLSGLKPVREDYVFLGWALASDAKTAQYQPGADLLDDTAATDGVITLYAVWGYKDVVVTFSANGGYGTMASQTFRNGVEEALKANDFARTGYEFKYWNTKEDGSGTDYTDKQSVTLTGDITLYAIWGPCVIYHANNGTQDKFVQTLPRTGSTVIGENRYTYKGYNFKCWNTEADGSGTDYTQRQSVKLTDETELYAVWLPYQYTVRFNANGGIGTMEDQSFEYDKSQALTANAFTRTGRKFQGWSLTAGGEVKYKDKESVKNLNVVGEDVKDGKMVMLYAVWDAPSTGGAIRIQQGSNVIASMTPKDGDPYVFKVSAGVYNVVVTSGDKTVTTMVETGGGEVKGPSAISPETASSVLELKGGAPDVVVGNLDIAADDNRVFGAKSELKLTVESKEEEDSDAQQSAIRALCPSGKALEYLDLTLTKSVDGKKDETFSGESSENLILRIPFTKAASKDITVFRWHNGRVDTLTTRAQNGEYIKVENDAVTLYVRQFCTYAICYTPKDPSITYLNCPRNQICPIHPFDDASTMSWYHDGVHWAIDAGAMQGVTARRFYPNSPTTRAQLVVILWRLEGSPRMGLNATFEDVPEGAWYAEAVAWASLRGIVTGQSETVFNPNGTLTREQMATILYRYIQLRGRGNEMELVGLGGFSDAGSVSKWAREGMDWLTTCGILEGAAGANGTRLLDPKGTATRAQVATVMMRYWESFAK